MADTASLTILKEFVYRGTTEEFSNTYHFSGSTPADAAAWRTFVNAVVAAEQPTVTSAVNFVGAYGYEPGNEHAVYTLNYVALGETKPPGTMTLGSMIEAPGDAAATLRWATGAVGSTGKPIYLRKYMHPTYFVSGSPDSVASTQKTALLTYAGKWTDGTLPGGRKVCRPQGGDGGAAVVSPWITTRTLKRRGKRPPT